MARKLPFYTKKKLRKYKRKKEEQRKLELGEFKPTRKQKLHESRVHEMLRGTVNG